MFLLVGRLLNWLDVIGVEITLVGSQGFIQIGGGGLEFPSPPEILKLSMVIIVLSQVLNNNLVPDCVRSNLRGSKFKIFLGGHAPRPPSRHTHLCVCEHAFTTLLSSYNHPVSPLHLKILYETMTVVSFPYLCTDILERTSMHGDSCKRCLIHLALYTCMECCAHPDLWSWSNKSLLSVANNLMWKYILFDYTMNEFMLLGFWLTLVHCCLNNRHWVQGIYVA